MLALQEYILTHPNWREELTQAPYSLKISEQDGYVLFKYNQIESDFNQPICREARGVILDAENGFRVVRLAFYKFFNIDEPYAAQLDWYSAIATEKIDGSIMTVWYGRGGWRVSTNGTIDAYKAELAGVSPYKTFGELFDAAAKTSGLNYDVLNPEFCYTFELVSPWNKVVLSYPEPALYHLSTRYLGEDWENTEFEEIEVNIGVRKPKVYALNTEKEYRQCVADMPEGHEGIVIRDAFYRRVKVKTPLYFELHRMSNNGVLNAERVVELIRANDYEEFLSYFPEHRPYFESVKRVLNDVPFILADIQTRVDGWKSRNQMRSESTRRRWFAEEVSIYQLKALYFKAYDGCLYAYVDGMTTKQFIKTFGLEDK